MFVNNMFYSPLQLVQAVRAAKKVADHENTEYAAIVEWLDYAEHVLKITDSPVHDRDAEFRQYITFRKELDVQYKIFQEFSVKARHHTALTLTNDKWSTLQQRWHYVTTKTKIWLWRLDKCLPGRLGDVGDWLYKAEDVVETPMQPQERHEDTAEELKKTLVRHRVRTRFYNLFSAKEKP